MKKLSARKIMTIVGTISSLLVTLGILAACAAGISAKDINATAEIGKTLPVEAFNLPFEGGE